MLKKSMFFVAVASMVMATSCSQEDLATTQLSSNEISINPSMGLKTRAVETTISNLGSFTVNAFQDGAANYMDGVKYTSTDGSVWNTDAGKFYWPVEGKLHFYAYAPNEPKLGGTLKLDKNAQTLTDFSPDSQPYDQVDFVYAKVTGDMATNGKTGIDPTFHHALSEITISAKNSNTAYTVEVTGVKVGNVVTKATFLFPSTIGAKASWNLSTNPSDIGEYHTTWDTPTVLGDEISNLNAKNVPFMIIPQPFEPSSKASEKQYIALKVKITMQGGLIVRDGWVYVSTSTKLEMGKKYNYILDFTTGAGQDENGKELISGKNITLSATMESWDILDMSTTAKISGRSTSTDDFSISIDGTRQPVSVSSDGTWLCYHIGEISSTDAMFYNCKNITSLDLSNFDTSKVTSMSSMFSDCSNLASLDLSNFDTSKVTAMDGMFSGCNNLASLDLSNFDTSNVTSMNGMFSGCSNLTTLDLSNLNTTKAANMDYMFSSCSKLNTIYVVECEEITVSTIKNLVKQAGLSEEIVKTSK